MAQILEASTGIPPRQHPQLPVVQGESQTMDALRPTVQSNTADVSTSRDDPRLTPADYHAPLEASNVAYECCDRKTQLVRRVDLSLSEFIPDTRGEDVLKARTSSLSSRRQTSEKATGLGTELTVLSHQGNACYG